MDSKAFKDKSKSEYDTCGDPNADYEVYEAKLKSYVDGAECYETALLRELDKSDRITPRNKEAIKNIVRNLKP